MTCVESCRKSCSWGPVGERLLPSSSSAPTTTYIYLQIQILTYVSGGTLKINTTTIWYLYTGDTMSQSLFRLPSLRQSVCRELQRLLHSRASRGKTSNPARPHPLCSFCYLQHQRLLSTEQAPVHRAKAVNAAGSLNDENRPPSGLTGEVDSARSSAWQQPDAWMSEFQGPAPQLNWDYLCNPDNRDFIRDNIANRKGVGDIDRVVGKVVVVCFYVALFSALELAQWGIAL